MGDIFLPRSLEAAEAILALKPAMEQILNNRKSIEDDIRKFHALNDTEAKKSEEARALIKKNSDILETARKISEENSIEREKIISERISFNEEKSREYEKIDIEKGSINLQKREAQSLIDEARAKHIELSSREEDLANSRIEHAKNATKLLQEQKLLDEKRRELEEHRQAVIDLDRDTRAKVEALKKFNF